MLTLLSPAKKQTASPLSPTLPSRQPRFISKTTGLMKLLSKMDAEALMKLMHISSKLAELNVQRNQDFSFPHTLENATQAGLVFDGDTYIGLDSHSFSKQEWEFCHDHLAILSGLYGLLSPLDLIQPHRLEMGTRLQNPIGATLYAYWGEQITEEINRILEHKPDNWLINLASQEYFKVVRTDKLDSQLLTPVFKDNRNGKLQVIGIKAKRARGKMARYIIRNKLTTPEPLKQFNEDGYVYQSELSNRQQWVFVCDD
ncbi:MAG: peroxide stress protein YaaA [Magnetococcales bacterium]|nr:peroxide stress protein YaaA [Magnetococcales bacterium]